jgi:hypothetical protein
MLLPKDIKFSYDMSNIWEYEVLARGNAWMDLDTEKELLFLIDSQGFYGAINAPSIWNKISTKMFATPVVVHDGVINFMIPNTNNYLEESSIFMSAVGEAIAAFHKKDFERSSFPSTTIFNVTKTGINGLDVSESLEPLKTNIAYNLIVLFLVLNIAI